MKRLCRGQVFAGRKSGQETNFSTSPERWKVIIIVLTCFFFIGFSGSLKASPVISTERREPAPILAPFGMRWGITPEDFQLLIKNFKVQSKIIREGEEIRAIQVTGIPQKNLLATLFHFEEGMLWEIELQLGDKKWGEEEYNNFFLMTKRVLERRYGVGQPVATQTLRVGDIDTTLGGYVWRQFGGSIQLYLFHAKRGDEQFFLISQHFRPK